MRYYYLAVQHKSLPSSNPIKVCVGCIDAVTYCCVVSIIIVVMFSVAVSSTDHTSTLLASNNVGFSSEFAFTNCCYPVFSNFSCLVTC